MLHLNEQNSRATAKSVIKGSQKEKKNVKKSKQTHAIAVCVIGAVRTLPKTTVDLRPRVPMTIVCPLQQKEEGGQRTRAIEDH